MPKRWSTVRRQDEEQAPGLDLSRTLVVGFLIAAAIGLLAGMGWLGYLWVTRLLGAH